MINTSEALSGDSKINIVYYGPAVAGKTTNLYYIYSHLAPENKGKIVTQQTDKYQSIFFDFRMPDIRDIRGHDLIFRAHCLSGCLWDWEKYNRKLLLTADAVVFVVDSHIERLEANLEMLEMLTLSFQQQNDPFDTFPWVIQYNKRDVPKHQIFPVHDLQKHLNWYNVPYFEAIATQGIGVFETLNAVVQLAITKNKNG